MTELFNAVTRGVSRFVLTWLLPSALVVAVFALSAGNAASSAPPIARLRQLAQAGPVAAAAAYALTSLTLGTLLAYGSFPIYRLLEGYTLPPSLHRRWSSAQRKRWMRISHKTAHLDDLGLDTGELREQLGLYPEDSSDIRPTRLGNALRALETYGSSRYGLNSQELWYELRAVAPDVLRSDAEEARGAVDLFVSVFTHLCLLSIGSLIVAVWYSSFASLLVAAVSVVMLRPAYDRAVGNVLEWRYAVQALVNLSRVDLASKLGLVMPHDFRLERWMWQAVSLRLERGQLQRDNALDQLRRQYPSEHSTYSRRTSPEN